MSINRKIFTVFIGLILSACQVFCQGWKIQPIPIQTRWAKEVTPENALKEYPRPQMVRASWQNLNGLWQYAITKDAQEPKEYKEQILVPYPIESALSGVKKAVQPTEILWYRKYIPIPVLKNGERILLHFGAVDWEASVFINNKNVGSHTGGYDNFSFDITDAVKKGNNELKVKVRDPTDQGINPHGKQVLNPKDIWYTPTTGIWQTVWMEIVPKTYISNIKLTTDIDKNSFTVEAETNGFFKGYSLEAILIENGGEISSGRKKIENKIEKFLLKVNNPRLWSPEDPFLYDIKIRLLNEKGDLVDEIKSYYGLRKVS